MTNDLQIKKKKKEKLNDFGEEGSDLLVPFLFHW